MNFIGLPLAWCAAVLGAAGAALVVMHLLRVRPRRRTVVTVMFWRHQEAGLRAPTMLERLRHKRTLAMLLLIALLLAVAMAGPVWRDRPPKRAVVVIDGGMSMAAPAGGGGTRYDEAKRFAANYATSAGGDYNVAVIACDPTPRVALAFDRPRGAASRLLEGLTPSTRPAMSAEALLLASELAGSAADSRVVWVTDRAAVPSGLPEAVARRVERVAVGKTAPNAAVLSAVFEPSGDDPARGDVRARVATWGPAQANLEARVMREDGAVVLTQPLGKDAVAAQDVLVRDVVADGSMLRVELVNDAGPNADDAVEARLPRRKAVKFHIADDVPVALRMACESIGAGAASGDSEAIEVSSSAGPVGRSAVVVVGAAATGEAKSIVPAVGEALAADLNFEGAACVDSAVFPAAAGRVLASAGGRPVMAMNAGTGGARVLYVSEAMFNGEAASRAATLVLLSRATRELAGWSGAPLSLSLERRMRDPLWGGDSDARAGDRVTSDLSAAAPGPTVTAPHGVRIEVYEALLGAALGLLLVEAWLFGRGRIV